MTRKKKGGELVPVEVVEKIEAEPVDGQTDQDPSKPLRLPRHEAFARLLVQGRSGRFAYHEVYGTPIPPDAQSQRGYDNNVRRLRIRPDVAARIAYLTEQAASAAATEKSRVLAEISLVAFSRADALMDDDGHLIDPAMMPPGVSAAVSSVEYDEFGRVKVKMWDKLAALEKLAKINGLYEVDNRQKTDPFRELAAALGGQVVGGQGIDLGEA